VPNWGILGAVSVAGLFALHPQQSADVSLGLAFRRLRNRGGSDSVERRFTSLLDCHRDDLPERLRGAVTLFRSKEIGLDWQLLLVAWRCWESGSRWVQRRWARDYWGQEV
jgi:CRISPR type I-E-associated protein CasB/Cse2